MKKFETEKITDLSEIFFALMGGCPEDIREIENFMKTSPLNQLMFASDIERIIKYDGFFPDETVDAVYSLLPIEIPLGANKNEILMPQAFRKINAARVALPASRVIDISFPKAISVYTQNYSDKNKKLVRILCNIKDQREENLLYPTNSSLNSEVKNEKQTPIKTKRPYRSARKTRYGSRYKKGELPQFVVKQMQKVKEEKERQQKEDKNRQKEEKKLRCSREKQQQKAQERETYKLQKEQEKEIKNALKRLKAEKEKEEKLKKQEASKIYIQRKNRRQQKQILREREQQQRLRQEEQVKVWQEIARLDNKKQELEKRKNTPFEQLSVEDQEKEKQRRRMAELRKWRPRKDTRIKIEDLTPEEQEIVREANRRRNAVYRVRHREEIRASRNEARARLKQDDPELLKEMDRKNNAKPARKKAARNYYLTHNAPGIVINSNNKKNNSDVTDSSLSPLIQGFLNTKSR